MKTLPPSLVAVAAALALALAAAPAAAQAPAARTIVAEPVAVVPAFLQWVHATVVPLVEPLSITTVQSLPWAAPQGNAQDYQPRPVILGAPELPLLRPMVETGWSATLNYQGMHVQIIAVDASGRQRSARPLTQAPKAGERFKLRVTPSFDAVADIDLVGGEQWVRSRLGQVYPQPGMSVQIRAGETADLPVGQANYFVMPRAQSLVLSVRHPKAIGEARNNQPAYRIDGRSGSDYLQLVPANRAPLIEQLLASR